MKNIKAIKDMMLLYAVTDRAWVGRQTLIEQVEDSLKGGVTCLQLREKDLDYTNFLIEAVTIKKLCNKYNVPFIINDNIDIAIKSNADGIHIGQDDIDAKIARELIGENKILGVSVKNVEQAIKAKNDGADYIGVGAIFPTSTKLDATMLSIDELNEICKIDIPIVAIGGINKNNIEDLKETNIDGVALVSSIYANENIEQATKELKNKCLKIFKS